MSQFRNVSNDARRVAYGLPPGHARVIDPDGVLTVTDDVDESYACQPAVWRPVEAAPKKKTAIPEESE